MGERPPRRRRKEGALLINFVLVTMRMKKSDRESEWKDVRERRQGRGQEREKAEKVSFFSNLGLRPLTQLIQKK